MTAPPLDSPAAAFVGQLPGSHRVRLLAALLGLKMNEVQNLPVGIPTAEQDAEYARRIREGGTSLSAEELVECLKTADTPAELRPPELTPELEAELDDSLRNPGDVLSAQEWVAGLKRQAAATQHS